MHNELERWSKSCAANLPFLSLLLPVLICSAALSEACNINDKPEKVLCSSLACSCYMKVRECNVPGHQFRRMYMMRKYLLVIDSHDKQGRVYAAGHPQEVLL